MASFRFDLVSPERLVLSAEADQVDLPGSEGDFGILAGHAPFLTTLRPGIVTARLGSNNARYFIRGGFADVNAAGLTVLAERAIPLEELKADQIAVEISDAEEDVTDAASPAARQKAELHLNQLRELQAALKPA